MSPPRAVRLRHLLGAGILAGVLGLSVCAPAWAAPQTHTVREGDTVERIARRYGISWKALAEANGLKPPYLVRIGDTLRLPGTAPAGGTGGTGGTGGGPTPGSAWVVEEGDTVTAIAGRAGVSWQAVVDTNGLQPPYVIVPGQKLKIPGASASTGTNSGGSDGGPAPGGTYVVRRGDTVTRIAGRAGVSWRAVVDANGLQAPYVIIPGQALAIPDGGSSTPSRPSGDARAHVVAEGDTLERIARRYGVDWKRLADVNGIRGPAYLVVIGQRLEISGVGGEGAGTGGAGSGQPATAAGSYLVQAGDTLERIGRRAGVPWRAIAEANGVKGPTFVIREGQALEIPAGAANAAQAAVAVKEPTLYTVRRGDTLTRIAARNNTTVLAIVAANGIADPNVIREGQQLRIVPPPPGAQLVPAPAQSSGRSGSTPPGGDVERSLEKWAHYYGVPEDLVKGLAWVESAWRPGAVSGAGAVGVMQLMPGTAAWLSDHVVHASVDRYNLDENVRGGTAYLSWLLDQVRGNERLALGSYYQGLGATQEHGLYRESEVYVEKVQGSRKRYGD